MEAIVQASLVFALYSDGTIKIETTSNGVRQKVNYLTGGMEQAIREKLEQLAADKREVDITAAKVRAAEEQARHVRIVKYATDKNPTTLQYIEPGAKPSAKLRQFLFNAGYSRAEIAEMAADGTLGAEAQRLEKAGKITATDFYSPAAQRGIQSSENIPI